MSQDMNANPSVIARETLKQLAILKIPPTPDSYHKLYDQIAGNPDHQISVSTAKMLSELAKEFPRHTTPLLNCANNLEQAVTEKSWLKFKSALLKFLTAENLDTDVATLPVTTKNKATVSWAEIIGYLMNETNNSNNVSLVAKKRKSIEKVLNEFSDNSELLHANFVALIQSWKISTGSNEQAETTEEIPSQEKFVGQQFQGSCDKEDILKKEYDISGYVGQLLGLMAQVLERIIANQIQDEVLAGEAKRLARQVLGVQNKLAMEKFIADFQEFCSKCETDENSNDLVQQGLLKLLNLLMDSTGELLSEDRWIKSQLTKLKKAMSGSLDMQVISQAEALLEKIVQRQLRIKQNLSETRETMQKMVASLISNLEELSDATGGYYDKLEYYSDKIKQTKDIKGLNQLLAEIMLETQKVQKSVLTHRSDLLVAQTEMNAAQSQITQLEAQLQEMSEQVQEDHLTGALNRRGFDNAFRREVTYLSHTQGLLCFALLDIDNFKQLNDTHGHQVGDDALVYLVEAVKETLRREDVISRYGGEEFAILLPNSALKEAISTIARIKRYLTKKFFLHGNNRLLITFSAGVAQYQPGESQESLFKRADEALYRAKSSGKNQIVAAE
ncbi:GGDEF domain-containing protein [Nitrosomonas sp. sh817]|uniref:GGDEF domain-containing protein n=1 Tax=Nitrosomonas sp. sh817 TaxID=3070658 RepID=UPI0027DB7304|nr:GGDEF domain-containing protein [Nitrosomonas sp. sh817]WMJ08852.1 diguanylate cyclase [Nitrosomonas sp. sh817]